MFQRIILSILLCVFLCSFDACSEKTIDIKGAKLETQDDSVAYAIGVNLGSSFKRDSLKLNLDLLVAGIRDISVSDTTLLTQEQLQQVFMGLQQRLTTQQQKNMEVQKTKNSEEGQKFLEENKKKAGVKVTPSGLQYMVIKEGTGMAPDSNDEVTVHYEGILIAGKVFDSSIKRGEPATFRLNQVVKGWQEGIQLMKEGGKIKLFVPAELGYGEQGPPEIGPNATLIFEVDLIKVNKKDASDTGMPPGEQMMR